MISFWKCITLAWREIFVGFIILIFLGLLFWWEVEDTRLHNFYHRNADEVKRWKVIEKEILKGN